MKRYQWLVKKSWYVIITLILFLPITILVLSAISFSVNVINLNRGTYEEIEIISPFDIQDESNEEIKYILSKPRIDNNTISFYNFNSPQGEKREHFEENDTLIYIFGASSVVKPSYDFVFGRYLENMFGNNTKVVNFGMDGMRQEYHKEMIQSILSENKTPDIIILYSGHNDYNNLYSIIRQKTNLLDKTFPVSYFLYVFEKLKFNEYTFPKNATYVPIFTVIDWVIEPNIKKNLQQIGLLKIRTEFFHKLDQRILAEYQYYTNSIIKIVRRLNTSLIIITPISNFEAEPFGKNNETWVLFKKALAEQDYLKRIDFLISAKDNDVFSGHLRAKSELNEFIRSINESNIYVLDLEQEMIDQKFNFSYEDFYDYVHMKPGTHKLISEILYEFIMKNKLI